jgi:hypothetical protein
LGAMMVQTYSSIIRPSWGMAIAPYKKETRSNLKLCRDRKVRRRPTSQRLVAEGVSNHLAGRDAPPAGLFYLEVKEAEELAPGDGSFLSCSRRNRPQGGLSFCGDSKPRISCWRSTICRAFRQDGLSEQLSCIRNNLRGRPRIMWRESHRTCATQEGGK